MGGGGGGGGGCGGWGGGGGGLCGWVCILNLVYFCRKEGRKNGKKYICFKRQRGPGDWVGGAGVGGWVGRGVGGGLS